MGFEKNKFKKILTTPAPYFIENEGSKIL